MGDQISAAGAAYQDEITALTSAIGQELNQLAKAPRGQDTTGLRAEITANSAQLSTQTAAYSACKANQAQNSETVSIAAPAPLPDVPFAPPDPFDPPELGPASGFLD